MKLLNLLKNKTSTRDIDNLQTLTLIPGDVFYTKSDGNYHLFKLLAEEKDANGYHVLIYSPVQDLPTAESLNTLSVMVYHSPFSSTAFVGAEKLTNVPILATDLVGYHEYLRQTQDPSTYISIANKYYKEGYALTDLKKLYEAIDAYSKAIDLFPPFFEAIDNRAFCKMDLGLWTAAIEDFKLSLKQNPNSLLAMFSIGECYFKLEEYENAKKYFEDALHIDSTYKPLQPYLSLVNKILNTN